MNRTGLVIALVALLGGAFPLVGQERMNPVDENDDGVEDQWLELGEEDTFWFVYDTNYDGIVDYRAQMDEEGRKLYEEMDYNLDGRMDDFYYYEKGILIREEVDTNFDDVIDLWVFLEDGVFVRRYEQDTDFDGEIDLVKDYAAEEGE